MLKNFKFKALLLFVAISLLNLSSIFAQVGIGTNTPAEGLMIYQTSAPAGFYY